MKICHEPYLISGIAVGNGFTDPITILDYSKFVYQMGLVDTNTYNDMKVVEEAGKTAIQDGRLVDAFMVYTTFNNLSCGFQPSVYPCQSNFYSPPPPNHEAGKCSGNNVGFYSGDLPIDYRSGHRLN
jgi:hypothetical protein